MEKSPSDGMRSHTLCPSRCAMFGPPSQRRLHMGWPSKLVFALIAVLGLPCQATTAQVSCEVKRMGGRTQITLMNRFLRLVAVPESGGRLVSFCDRRTNAELTYWDDGQGGVLDDRGAFTSARYAHRLHTDPEKKGAALTTAMRRAPNWESRSLRTSSSEESESVECTNTFGARRPPR